MLTARGRSEDVLRGFRCRRGRLSAEAVRAADPHRRACRACCGVTSGSAPRRQRRSSAPVASQFTFGDKSIDFEQLEVRVGEKRCR